MGKKGKIRTEAFSIRLASEENERLENYAREHHMTKTQTMVKGLEMLYCDTKKEVQEII